MSLILEALKKSEAKRRLGEAPDLATPFATPRRRSSMLPLLLIAVVAASAFGWWYLRARAPAPAAAQVANATPATKAPTNPTLAKAAPVSRPAPPAPMPVQVAANGRPSAPPTAPVAPAVKPAAREPDAAKWVATPQTSAASNRTAIPGARKLPPNMHRVDKPDAAVATKSDASAKPDAAVATKSDAPAKAAVVANAPALGKAPKTPDMRGVTPAGETAKAPDVAVASAAPKPAPPPEPSEAKNVVPFYYELPFNVRKALPRLRLSMHVYAANAAQRFVILNDSRLVEGDKTSEDVTLREVRPDGAVLEFQGQRFFYPRDGM